MINLKQKIANYARRVELIANETPGIDRVSVMLYHCDLEEMKQLSITEGYTMEYHDALNQYSLFIWIGKLSLMAWSEKMEMEVAV